MKESKCQKGSVPDGCESRPREEKTMSENFLFEQGQIATITFKRPERRNCLTREVLLELEELLLTMVRDNAAHLYGID